MGISDIGMINVFRNYFQLIRNKYFGDDGYKYEVDYEDLNDCFVYPAKANHYFEFLNQRMIDEICQYSKNLSGTTISDQYNVMRIGLY